MRELEKAVGEILEDIQISMYRKAKAHLESHTYEARTKDEFVNTFAEKAGFVKAMWCGEQECEEKIKEDMSVTSRCMPYDQECLSDTCVYCGKPAKKMVYWGKAY